MTDTKIDFEYDQNKFNAENPLILPSRSDASKKRKPKKAPQSTKRVLSNKERKHKEKIQQRKIESESRQELWDQLKALEDISLAFKAADQSRNGAGKDKKQKLIDRKRPHEGGVKQWKKQKLTSTEMESNDVDTDEFSSTEEMESEVPDTKEENVTAAVVQESSTTQSESVNLSEPPSSTETSKQAVTSTKTNSRVQLNEPKHYVMVERSKTIQKQRSALPVVQDEFAIMEALDENDIIFLCGNTGSGKSTQMPQFLYEAGFTRNGKRIGVTEPRRIAAISVSKRVAEELSLTEKEVSYQIRFEKTASGLTQILFMTDGILLQELKNDLYLKQYSAVIIDEAHERSAHTDICLALLCLAVAKRRRDYDAWRKRQTKKLAKKSISADNSSVPSTKPEFTPVQPLPLKVIIMSATLNVEELRDNTRLFGWMGDQKPPLINVETQTKRRVIPFFNKTTPQDYVTAAFMKVCKIHRESPAGHILVFLTGAAEVKDLCARLRAALLPKGNRSRKISSGSIELLNPSQSNRSMMDKSDGTTNDEEETTRSCRILPLYSALAPEKQARIFNIAKPKVDRPRVIIVSTNVAETSLTIPHVMYVVDSGRVKRLIYNPVTSISTHVVDWCSRASAIQRAGRAARIIDPKWASGGGSGGDGKRGAGRCYYLYTSYRLEHEMAAFDKPEILLRPVDDVLLTIKSLWRRTPISQTHLPSLPDERALQTADNRLLSIGALTVVPSTQASQSQISTDITMDGLLMEKMPVAPRFSRMILAARHAGSALVDHVLLLVACLSVEKLFVSGKITSAGDDNEELSDNVDEKRRQFVRHTWELLCGDLSVMLGTMCTIQLFHRQLREEIQLPRPDTEDQGKSDHAKPLPVAVSEKEAIVQTKMSRFLESYGLTWRGYQEAENVRKQLYHSLSSICPDWELQWCEVVTPPTKEDLPLLRELIFTGIPFQVARKVDCSGISDKELKKQLRWAYETAIGQERVYIHISSVLNKEKFEYVAYLDSFSSLKGKKFINGVFVLEPSWLSLHGHFYCSWNGAKTLQPISSGSSANSDTIPLPRYLGSVDSIVCYARQLFYGSSAQWVLHECPLPLQRVLVGGGSSQSSGELSSSSISWDPDRVYTRWLARFLIEGALFEKLKKWTIREESPPQILTLSVNLVRGSAINLVQALHDRQVKGKVDLMKIWKDEPSYLLQEILPWYKEECHRNISKSWPPL